MNMCSWKSVIRRWTLTSRLLFVFFSFVGFTASASPVAAADLEQYVHRLVNEHRAAQGLKPLAFNPEISAIARRHSQDMATGQVGVGHAGAQGRQQAVARIITLRGFAENIAANNGGSSHAGDMAVADWLTSPGHRKSIEGAYDLTGIGIAQGPTGAYFFTQLFVRTPSFRPGVARNDTMYKSSAPTPHAIKSERQVAETRQPYTYKTPYKKPRYEKDPRKRPGRKRTAQGWVQELD